MFISCPNCSTRYNVSPAQLGVEGKSVKCSNCGNTWHQRPVADAPPPMQPQHPQAPQAYPGYPPPPPQGYPGYPPPPPGYPPYPYPPQQAYPGYPPPEGQPAPGAPAAAPPPPEAAPAPAPAEPAPVEEEADEATLPEMDDDDPMAAFATDDDDDSADAADDDDQLSSEDIEAMFGDDDDDPEPLGSMVEGGGDDDEEEGDIEDFDDLEEPEPIPQVFTAEETGDDEYEDDDEEHEDEGSAKGSLMKIILAAVLAVVIGVLCAAVFLKDVVIEMIPATEGIYSMIGLGDDSLGAGLSINDVKRTRESISGKDVLVVRGVIANVSDRERSVPMLELRLTDLDGKLVQSATTAPLKKQLTAGDQIGFKIQVEEPSPLARRLEVTFIEGADGHGEKKAAH